MTPEGYVYAHNNIVSNHLIIIHALMWLPILWIRTLTPPVDFKECIRALKDHAFVKSKYPVIITFEDHLTSSLQAKAAKVHT